MFGTKVTTEVKYQVLGWNTAQYWISILPQEKFTPCLSFTVGCTYRWLPGVAPKPPFPFLQAPEAAGPRRPQPIGDGSPSSRPDSNILILIFVGRPSSHRILKSKQIQHILALNLDLFSLQKTVLWDAPCECQGWTKQRRRCPTQTGSRFYTGFFTGSDSGTLLQGVRLKQGYAFIQSFRLIAGPSYFYAITII